MRSACVWGSVVACLCVAMLCAGCGAPGEPGERVVEETSAGSEDAGAGADGEEAGRMVLESSAFADGQPIPGSTAHNAENQSPPLAWSGVPEGTESFAITCIDLHPIAGGWVHWLVTDIPAGSTSLAAGASGTGMPQGSREFPNTFGQKGWGGPQPPPGSGVHEYEFVVYALDVERVDADEDAVSEEVVARIQQHTLGSARLVGTSQR